MAKKKQQASDAPFEIDGMRLVVEEVQTYTNKYTGKPEAGAVVKIGPLPLLYSRLNPPSQNPRYEDKYTTVLQLTQEQRSALIEQLAPVAVEIAAEKLMPVTLEEAKSLLKNKLKEGREDGTYKLSCDQRVKIGERVINIVVEGPGGQPLESPFLGNGPNGEHSMALVNTYFTCVFNEATKKASFVFRPKAVRVTQPFYFERQEAPDTGSFDDIDPGY